MSARIELKGGPADGLALDSPLAGTPVLEVPDDLGLEAMVRLAYDGDTEYLEGTYVLHAVVGRPPAFIYRHLPRLTG